MQRLLRHVSDAKQGRFYMITGAFFDRVITRFRVMLEWVLQRKGLTQLVALGTLNSGRMMISLKPLAERPPGDPPPGP